MDMVQKSFLFTAKTNLYHALGFIFTYADFAFLDEKYIQVICQDFGEDRTFDASRSKQVFGPRVSGRCQLCNLFRVMNYRGYMYMKAIR